VRFFVIYTSGARVGYSGPFSSIDAANTACDRIRLMGFKDAFVSAEQSAVGIA
jgi:hypothetical protein